jgi:hypothetical protein
VQDRTNGNAVGVSRCEQEEEGVATMLDAVIHDTLVRMVVPMRREFGASLDVARMRRDLSYAHEVVACALHSNDDRLRRYAAVIDRHLLGIEPATAQQERHPAPLAAVDLGDRIRVAARALLDAVGPQGEALAIRIEASDDDSSLGQAVFAAATFIAEARGRAAAQAYVDLLGRGVSAS